MPISYKAALYLLTGCHELVERSSGAFLVDPSREGAVVCSICCNLLLVYVVEDNFVVMRVFYCVDVWSFCLHGGNPSPKNVIQVPPASTPVRKSQVNGVTVSGFKCRGCVFLFRTPAWCTHIASSLHAFCENLFFRARSQGIKACPDWTFEHLLQTRVVSKESTWKLINN